jgi:hypothetical protein
MRSTMRKPLVRSIALAALFSASVSAQDAQIDIYPENPTHGDTVVAAFTHEAGCSDVYDIRFEAGQLVIDLGPYRGQCFSPSLPQGFAVPVPGLLPGDYDLVVRFDDREGGGVSEVGSTTFEVAGLTVEEGVMADVSLPAERATLWWLPSRSGWAFTLFETPDFTIGNGDTHRSRVFGILNSYGVDGSPEWFLLEEVPETGRGCAPAYQIGCREFLVSRHTGAPVFDEDQGASEESEYIGTASIEMRSDPQVLLLTLDLGDQPVLREEELRRYTTLPGDDLVIED